MAGDPEGGSDEIRLGDGGATDDLLALIDRLEGLLERSDLVELEIEAAGTTLVLRKPAALAPPVDPGLLAALARPDALPDDGPAAEPDEPADEPEPARHAVLAPLTGIFYTAPAPDAADYVRVGGEVAVGQVIGLIEAMKLFNEIKSDVAGKVVRIVAESGTLVKAKQPLIEVEPI